MPGTLLGAKSPWVDPRMSAGRWSQPLRAHPRRRAGSSASQRCRATPQSPASPAICRVSSCPPPLRRARCQHGMTKFWPAVIHAAASTSPQAEPPCAGPGIPLRSPATIHAGMPGCSRAAAQTVFVKQSTLIFLRACDARGKATPAMSPTTCATPTGSPPSAQWGTHHGRPTKFDL